jgi:hypothetical protein
VTPAAALLEGVCQSCAALLASAEVGGALLEVVDEALLFYGELID